MIKKLKRKFVLINMLMVAAVLIAVCVTLYVSSSENIRRNSEEVLQRVLLMDSAPSHPGEGGESIQLPYFSVLIFSDGSAHFVGGSYYEFESVEEVQDILAACIRDGQESGLLKDYHLRYLRYSSPFWEKIAFVDTSLEQSTLRHLLFSIIAIALAALAVLTVLSRFLASRVVKPVEQSMERQRQFISDASHELKTPLTVILSNVSLLSEDIPPESENGRFLDGIEAESRRMKSLVEDMLTLEHSEDPQRPTEKKLLSLSELVTDETLLFEPPAFENGRRITSEIEDGITVRGAEEQLREILSVLLDNAIKYSPPGGEITLKLCRSGRKALLTVANAAESMDEALLSRLFDRFYRQDSSREETGGFGLGLSIARAIAEKHGGTLDAASADGTITFTFAMPAE